MCWQGLFLKAAKYADQKMGVAKVKGAEPEQFFIFPEVHRSNVRASNF
jgi:hypothetical protein